MKPYSARHWNIHIDQNTRVKLTKPPCLCISQFLFWNYLKHCQIKVCTTLFWTIAHKILFQVFAGLVACSKVAKWMCREVYGFANINITALLVSQSINSRLAIKLSLMRTYSTTIPQVNYGLGPAWLIIFFFECLWIKDTFVVKNIICHFVYCF